MDKQDWRMPTAIRIVYIVVLGTTLAIANVTSNSGMVIAAVVIASAVVLFMVVQWLD